MSAAGWLATTGATLLLLASIVVVAGRWESITPEVRFAGLVASLLGIYFVAETIRERLTATASALAVLAATITAPVGIAAAATLEQPWPVCVLVGGLLALVATEIQSRRWSVPTLKVATAVAVGLAASGAAALTSTPVGVLGAVAAALALALGAERRSIALATAASAVPFLFVLADAGIGVGTLARLGATGPSLDWGAPLTSVIAAVVIAIAAHRRSSLSLVALSIASLAVGGMLGLSRLESSAAIWWTLPAASVLLVHAVIALAPGTVWARAARLSSPFLVAPLAVGAMLSPLLTSAARAIDDLSDTDLTWALPLGLTALALFAATSAPGRSTRAVVALFTAACLATFATSLLVGTSLFGWDDVATLWGIAGLTSAVSWRRGNGWLHSAAVLAAVATGASMATAGLSAGSAALWFVAISVAATGIAFLRPLITPLDTFAAATAVLSVAVVSQAPAEIRSLVLTVIGSQIALYALARRQRFAAAGGALLSISGAWSLWWTTGTNDAVIEWLRPYGADGGDLVLTVAALFLLLGGLLLRRLQPLAGQVSSWLAYSPGLGLAAAWLIDAQLDSDGLWATLGGLTVGLVAVGLGGWRRLGAPLVLGTVLLVASLLASIGSQLAAAPTWLWIAAGGAGLLLLAALIERSERPLIIADTSGEPTLVQQFCRDFD